ncbi:MAG: hypothetical protein RL664_603, partial [Bacteroidota bacterium]
MSFVFKLKSYKILYILKKIVLLTVAVILILASVEVFGQGTSCETATPVCTGVATTYTPATTGSAPVGNNYGTLGTSPVNPSWFVLTVGNAGNIVLTQTASCNQNYVLWGPFTTFSQACSGLAATPFLSDASAGNGNTISITNAIAGRIYILLLSNLGGCAGSVTISQTSGTGTLVRKNYSTCGVIA